MAKKKEPLHQITKHDLVPDHIIITEKEKAQLLQQYKIEANQLPKILDEDPVIRSIGAKPGQVVKIIRKSDTAKTATAYRFVIESSK